MSLFKKIFKIKEKNTHSYRYKPLRRGRKVYKSNTVRVAPRISKSNSVASQKKMTSTQKIHDQIPQLRVPEPKKLSPKHTYQKVKIRQPLDLRSRELLPRVQEGIVVKLIKLITKALKGLALVTLSVAIILWNITVAVFEFVIEHLLDALFFLKQASLYILGFTSALLGYVFAGIKSPQFNNLKKFKFPKIEIPDIRIPQIDIHKKDREEVPFIETNQFVDNQDMDKSAGVSLTSKTDWFARLVALLKIKIPLPGFLTRKRGVPIIKTPAFSVDSRFDVFPKSPEVTITSALSFLAVIGAAIAGGYYFLKKKITSFTLSVKRPTIKKKQISNLGTTNVATATGHNTQKVGIWARIMKAADKHTSSKFGRFLWRLFILGCILGFIAIGAFFIWVATLEIPELGNFADRQVRQSTKIYDKTGTVLLYDVFKEERRTVVPLSEISPNIQEAILATEDDKFYDHHGVRPIALVRSILDKIMNPETRLAGGSTITQQVIKNAILTNERAIERKVKEWVLAWRLENQLSKEEILEAYLNEIAFGGSVYGVEQAARSFFGKSASELSITESAYIAAVPKAPTFYSPYGNNVDRLEGRKDYILGRMLELEYITNSEYNQAREEEVEFVVREDKGIKAPHFVFYVIEYLEQQYGAESIEKDGLKVITTLDWELQQGLEEVTAQYAQKLPQFNATNLATVAVEAQTGKIISMVGSKDYFADDIDGKFNVATSQRQPGSTFKPFVYAQAFENGFTPQTVLWDVKTEFSPSCFPDGTPQLPQYADRCYSPKNYDNSTRGPISMQSALAQSLNIPAVKALYLVGVGNAINTAKSLGITGLNRSASFYGLNLVLGGGEVRLVDMASAYSVFANEGLKNPPAAIMSVQAANGEILESYEKKETRVLSQNVARMINAILSDDNLKRPVFGSNSVLYHSDAQVAVKTGTTNSFRDTWTVGYTPDVSVGVWIGNNDNSAMAQRPSSTVAAPYWRLAMNKAREQYTPSSFTPPVYKDPSEQPPVLNGVWQGSERFFLDTETGLPADVTTPQEQREEQFLINYRSILHWVDKRNPLSGGNSQNDPLYQHFEEPISLWATSASLETAEDQLRILTGDDSTNEGDENIDPDAPRTNQEEVSSNRDSSVDFTFTSPENFAVIDADRRQDIEIRVTGPRNDVDRIFYYVNNTYLGSGGPNETSTSFTPSSIRTIQNSNVIRVIVQTNDGARIEKEQVFEIQ